MDPPVWDSMVEATKRLLPWYAEPWMAAHQASLTHGQQLTDDELHRLGEEAATPRLRIRDFVETPLDEWRAWWERERAGGSPNV